MAEELLPSALAKRQFVEVRFNRLDRRTYCYHIDGERAKVGDRVIVSTRNGEVSVEVVRVDLAHPSFATKPVLRIVPPEPPEAA